MSALKLSARGFPHPIEYWDIHAYYNAEIKESCESIAKLHQELRETFPDLRVFDLVGRPVGPHPVAMFEAHLVNPLQYAQVVGWLSLNRRGHSILVHPNTPDQLADHSSHTVWLGEPVKLNLSIFRGYLGH